MDLCALSFSDLEVRAADRIGVRIVHQMVVILVRKLIRQKCQHSQPDCVPKQKLGTADPSLVTHPRNFLVNYI